MTPNHDWKTRSLAHVWHPCTQMQDHAGGDHAPIPMLPVASAEGVWLRDFDGRRYLDAIGSWWTSIFGHRHPHVVARLKAQLDSLDHVMLAGFTHAPAVELAEKLCALAPPGLNRVFYAGDGSSAVEIALKMSVHYWRNCGRPRKTRFITLENGYHGETLGAMAVDGVDAYRSDYAPLLMQAIFVPSPDCYNRPAGISWEDHSRRQFKHMEAALARYADTAAAVILEPLIQGAAGMRMYHPVYLKLLREACDRHHVHLILDEIAVGFGRTGRMFAADWVGPVQDAAGSGQRPFSCDFMCLSKGLTNGTLPLSCVLTTDEVYNAFYADHASHKAFLHSHTYSGNPLACTAALATLELFEQEDWMARNRRTAALIWNGMSPLLQHPNVAEIRAQGMILAVELVAERRTRAPYPSSERRGLRAYRHALAAGKDTGVLLRPLGDVIYLMPPYTISAEEVALMCQTAIDSINHATAG